jgi:hypothetical protein
MMQSVYRFYIGGDENGVVDLDKVKKLAAEMFPKGYTVATGIGIWKGQVEGCATITVIREVLDDELFEAAAIRLADEFNQDCVMLEHYVADVKFVGRR